MKATRDFLSDFLSSFGKNRLACQLWVQIRMDKNSFPYLKIRQIYPDIVRSQLAEAPELR